MPRRAFWFALGVLLALVGTAHLYLVARLAFDTRLPEPWARLVRGACLAGAACMVAQPALERAAAPRIARVTAWPAYVWMGTCFYLLLGFWASDVVMAVAGFDGVRAERIRAAIVAGGTLVLLPSAMLAALRTPRVRRIELVLARWPRALDGYRIVQISDLHIGALLRGSFATRVVERCNELSPDLLAVTGDLVDGSVQRLASAVEPFRGLRARDGVYFVTGNHEYYSGGPRWIEKARELGMRVLENERVDLGPPGARFCLAGVNDLSARRVSHAPGHDLPRALDGWDRERPLVLLAHHPRTFEEASNSGVDLQLSGHTHGGQLWPFGYLVRLQTPHIAGSYGNARSRLYVSRGTGFWGPPMRVLAPAEITELVLRAPPT